MTAVLFAVSFIAIPTLLRTQAVPSVEAAEYEDGECVSMLQVRVASSSQRWDLISTISSDFAEQCETWMPVLSERGDDELWQLCTEAFSSLSCGLAKKVLGSRPWSKEAIGVACSELRTSLGSMTSALLERRSGKLHAEATHTSGLEHSLKRKGNKFPEQREVLQPPYYTNYFDCDQLTLWVNETNKTDGTVHYMLNYTNVTLFLNESYAEHIIEFKDNYTVPGIYEVPYEVQKKLNISRAENEAIIKENTLVSTRTNITPYQGIESMGTKVYVTNCSMKPYWEIPLAPEILPVTNASLKNRDWEDASAYLANSSSMNVTLPNTTNTTPPAPELNESVVLRECLQETQVEQCFGLKKNKKAFSWQDCQAACCQDDKCEVWQYNELPQACYMGKPKRCEGGKIWKYWDYGGKKKFHWYQETLIPRNVTFEEQIYEQSIMIDSNLTNQSNLSAAMANQSNQTAALAKPSNQSAASAPAPAPAPEPAPA